MYLRAGRHGVFPFLTLGGFFFFFFQIPDEPSQSTDLGFFVVYRDLQDREREREP